MRPSRTRTCVCLSLSKMTLSFAHGRRPDHLSSLSLVSKGLLSVEELLQRPHLQGLLRWCTTGGPLSSGSDTWLLPLSLSSSAMAAGSASELFFGPLNPNLLSLSVKKIFINTHGRFFIRAVREEVDRTCLCIKEYFGNIKCF